MKDSIKLKTFENIGYNAFAKITAFILQIVANIILAQNLVSSDYGIVGFAMIFIGFLSLFGDLGINSAVIQKDILNENGLYTGFTIKVILGVVIFITAFFISPVSNNFFDNNAVESVIKLLSLNFVINSLAFIPLTLLTRELNYRRLFIPHVGAAIVNFTLSIILSLNEFRYWSIVLANVCATATSVIILNTIRPIKIKFSFDKRAASEFFSYGGKLFLSGIIIFLILNTDNFVIGTAMGSEILGYYAIAFTWGAAICIVFENVVHSVLFPTFSKMQSDRERIRNAYLRVLEYVSFIGILINVNLLIISNGFLFFILGYGTDKWLPALTAFRILCAYGMLRVILVPVGNVVMALGDTGVLLRANIISAIIEIGLLYPALRYFDIEGAAIIVTIAYALQYLIFFPYLKKRLNLEFSVIFSYIRPAIISAGISILIIFLLETFWKFSLLSLFGKLFLSTAAYFISYGIITKWRLVTEVKSLIDGLKIRFQ